MDFPMNEIWIIFVEILHKACSGFFKFWLDFELLAKIKRDLVSTRSHETGLSITQDLNKTRFWR